MAAEQVLRNKPGIRSADVSFAAERGRIQYDPAQVNPSTALETLSRLGYRARLLTDPGGDHVARQQERSLLQLIVAAAFGMQVMLIYLVQLYHLYSAGKFDAPETRTLQYVV